MLKVLVACEHTGVVRDAFTALGHDAMSCDLLATETAGKHYQGNVLDIIDSGFDLMIAHPPCTYLSFAATHVWNTPGRAAKRLEALQFFLQLWNAPINHICIENPLGIADNVIQKHTQIVHPYYFGNSYLKRTCLWLKNLPKLTYSHTDNLFSERTATDYPEPVYIRKTGSKAGKKIHFTEATNGYHGEGNSFKMRSRTFTGIAEAMAQQWSDYLLNHKNP